MYSNETKEKHYIFSFVPEFLFKEQNILYSLFNWVYWIYNWSVVAVYVLFW